MLESCLAVLAAISMAGSPGPGATAGAVNVERFGLYVVAEDLDRASRFYEQLFAKKPQVRTTNLVAFDVAGGLYAIVSKEAYAPQRTWGDNVVPYIKVGDIFAAFQRAKQLAPASIESAEVIEEGSFKFFKLADPDGNIIEFFAVGPQ